MKTWLFILFSMMIGVMSAQTLSVKGRIEDHKHQPLPGATVTLWLKDSPNVRTGNVSDKDGTFVINNLYIGTYIMQVSFVGFNTETQTIKITQNGQDLGTFTLREKAVALNEVTAIGRESRAIQLSDTLKYNADAFKTLQGASAETLISKMPGIIVDNQGNIQAQGETVQQVLVDGKPFFNGDPTLALKNLPADIVQNIEVFDKKSDQAEFTGFDDGNSIKTINVMTRRGMQTGIFGKIVDGIGEDHSHDVDYQSSASINIFHGNRRITLLGMSNNINQQNFSQEDIAGVMGGGGFRGFRGGSFSSMSGGPQGGLTKTNAGGFNYTDNWGSKIAVTSGYFFNMTNNVTDQSINRTYFDASDIGRTYQELDHSMATNYNHRFNMKLDYKPNVNNWFTFTPAIVLQRNINNSSTFGQTFLNGTVNNQTSNKSNNITNASNVSLALLYRHRFIKPGRTISTYVNYGFNNNNQDGYYEAHSFFNSQLDTTNTYQTLLNNSSGYNWGSSLIYTEPISKHGIMQVSYQVNYNHRNIDQRAYQYLSQRLDTSLSNVYNSNYLTQSAGIGYRYRNTNGFMLMANLNVQHATLQGDEQFPLLLKTHFGYTSLLPIIMVNYKFSSISSLHFMFRSSTSAPSIQQLENVINNTNPLMVTGGNPDLSQQTTNRALFRYTLTPKSGQTFIVMFSAGQTSHYIGNSTMIAKRDSILPGGILLNKGAQYSYPVNLSGNWNANALLTYGFPILFLKSNLNLSTMLSYNRLPSIYNGISEVTNNYVVTPKAILGSNISDKLDFTLSYGASFNIARNEMFPSQNNTYLNQTAQFKFDWITWKGLTFENMLTYQGNSGMAKGYNLNYFLWNASIGKKIFKNQRGEIKLQAFDLLHQNKSLTQDVYDTYYQDVSTNVMKPYVMLTFTYDLRNFKGAQYQQQQQRQHHWEGMPGGRPNDGMRPPMGGGGDFQHPPLD
ncbi:MAG: outer membrane beta-barrel protein [Microbacter sp.]